MFIDRRLQVSSGVPKEGVPRDPNHHMIINKLKKRSNSLGAMVTD